MMTSDHYISVRAKIGMHKGYYKGERQLEKKICSLQNRHELLRRPRKNLWSVKGWMSECLRKNLMIIGLHDIVLK